MMEWKSSHTDGTKKVPQWWNFKSLKRFLNGATKKVP